jgi:eukaryotic-like serine/threonine-protein kinase
MDPERWKRIEEVYHSAGVRAPEEREAFLEGACAGDDALRREVKALLAVSTDGRLATSDLPVATHMVSDPVVSMLTGRRVGAYQIHERIGAGGMGEVYRARDTKLGRDVAIKVLPRTFADDPDRLARFEREARMLAALNHPHIATIHGIEELDGMRGLVLELVDGPTLAERIAHGLPIKESLTIAQQIAAALEAAHEKGIIHRDLKPANIKFARGGEVKVLDFGLAKAFAGDESGLDASQVPTLTATQLTGAVMGTPAYMSPEQARGQAIDKRTDIWAFGCVLYEMLTGRVAFAGNTISDTIAAILEREPAWDALPERTPAPVPRVLHRCLDKDLKRRLRDIGDVRSELEDALAGRETDALKSAPPRPLARRLGFAAAVAGVTLGVLGIWAFSRVEPETAAPPRLARFDVSLPPDTVISPTQNRQVAVSPDGSRIVYVGLRAGQRMLYMRRVDELEARPIEGTVGSNFAFFSPDGQWVGFGHGGRRALLKLALSGGAPVQVAPIDAAQGATWGPDGTIIYADVNLWKVPASGGTPTVLLKPNTDRGERGYRGPIFLPGGRAVLFTLSTLDIESYDDARIGVLNLETQERKILIEGGMNPHYSPSGHIVYARSGSLLAAPFDLKTLQVTGQPFPAAQGVFMSNNTGFAEFDVAGDGTLVFAPGPVEGGERTPVWVDRQGRSIPLPLPQRSYLHPRLSPDERQLAIEVEGATHDLFTYDFARSTLTKLTLDGVSHWPLWTPKGDRLTFRAWRGGGFTMWSMPADRSGQEERLTTIGAMQSAASWAPDGKAMAFTQVNLDTGPDVYVLPLSGDRTPVPVARGRFAEGSPKFSPDGRWLAYSSTESGRPEVFAQPWPGPGPKIQISTDGGTDPLWARQSGELFYRNGDKMMVSSVSLGQKLIASKPQLLWQGHYSLGMSSSCGVPGPTSANFDVTADGKRFLMIQDKDQDVAGRQLTVVLNWAEELKRLSVK